MRKTLSCFFLSWKVMFSGLEHSFPNIFIVWNMMGYLMHCIIYSYMHIYINHWTCDIYRIIAYLLWIILLFHDVINFLLSWVRINYWITFLNFKWKLFLCYSVKCRVLHYHIYTCHFILHKVVLLIKKLPRKLYR